MLLDAVELTEGEPQHVAGVGRNSSKEGGLLPANQGLGKTVLKQMVAEIGEQLANRGIDRAGGLSQMRHRDRGSTGHQTKNDKQRKKLRLLYNTSLVTIKLTVQ